MDDQQYKHAERQAQALEFKIRDLLDDKNHSTSVSLINNSKVLVQDLRSRKNPRTLEENVRNLLRLLESVRSNDQVIDVQHADWLLRSYEELQMSLRKFNNY